MRVPSTAPFVAEPEAERARTAGLRRSHSSAAPQQALVPLREPLLDWLKLWAAREATAVKLALTQPRETLETEHLDTRRSLRTQISACERRIEKACRKLESGLRANHRELRHQLRTLTELATKIDAKSQAVMRLESELANSEAQLENLSRQREAWVPPHNDSPAAEPRNTAASDRPLRRELDAFLSAAERTRALAGRSGLEAAIASAGAQGPSLRALITQLLKPETQARIADLLTRLSHQHALAATPTERDALVAEARSALSALMVNLLPKGQTLRARWTTLAQMLACASLLHYLTTAGAHGLALLWSAARLDQDVLRDEFNSWLPVVSEITQDIYTARASGERLTQTHDAWLNAMYEYQRDVAPLHQCGRAAFNTCSSSDYLHFVAQWRARWEANLPLAPIGTFGNWPPSREVRTIRMNAEQLREQLAASHRHFPAEILRNHSGVLSAAFLPVQALSLLLVLGLVLLVKLARTLDAVARAQSRRQRAGTIGRTLLDAHRRSEPHLSLTQAGARLRRSSDERLRNRLESDAPLPALAALHDQLQTVTPPIAQRRASSELLTLEAALAEASRQHTVRTESLERKREELAAARERHDALVAKLTPNVTGTPEENDILAGVHAERAELADLRDAIELAEQRYQRARREWVLERTERLREHTALEDQLHALSAADDFRLAALAARQQMLPSARRRALDRHVGLDVAALESRVRQGRFANAQGDTVTTAPVELASSYHSATHLHLAVLDAAIQCPPRDTHDAATREWVIEHRVPLGRTVRIDDRNLAVEYPATRSVVHYAMSTDGTLRIAHLHPTR